MTGRPPDVNGPRPSRRTGDRIAKTTATKRGSWHHTIAEESVNQPVVDKLWRLHQDHGYLTRAEIEAALGLDSPPGRWECPGEFGADGRYVRHCGGEAA